MTTESWFSNELKIMVMSKSTDLRYGDRISELKNIKREEPDKSLFVIPSGYTILVIDKVKE